jgi:hypothetical protein
MVQRLLRPGPHRLLQIPHTTKSQHDLISLDLHLLSKIQV